MIENDLYMKKEILQCSTQSLITNMMHSNSLVLIKYSFLNQCTVLYMHQAIVFRSTFINDALRQIFLTGVDRE